MAYGSNILKKEATYYTLNNASISNGVLRLNANGSATQSITKEDLALLPKSFQFTAILSRFADSYAPDIKVLLHIKMQEEATYCVHTLYPINIGPAYVCTFTLSDGNYDDFYVTISSSANVVFTLWELCPEVSDADVEVIIDGVRQSLPRLLFDYNTAPLEFGISETVVALITCNLLQKTDVQGHFIMSFIASQAATLTLRFYDNEAEELFAPILYDCGKGYNTVGVPHSYLSRVAGIHTFIVTAQMTAGACSADTRKILYTIDGGYLAARELDIPMDVTDISIRQLATDSGPDQIWAVGIEKGKALVKSRSYSESNASVSWSAVGSLGKARSAAIEFDGVWVLREGEEQFTLETEEEPWYFWVDEDDFLYACHGLPFEDRGNVVLLADSIVGDPKAVKGYSSLEYIEQDQGLIVAYLRTDGYAYYRSYCYDTVSHTTRWQDEQMLPVSPGQFTSINVHRLNDYRIGFELTGASKNLWLITNRTYVAQSIYPESYYISCAHDNDGYVPFVGTYPIDYAPTEPIVIDTRRYSAEEPYEDVVEEQHLYVYNYSTGMKYEDLGTVADVTTRYGAPQRDETGLYIIIDGHTTYVKMFSKMVPIVRYNTVYFLYAKLLGGLFASDYLLPVLDRLIFDVGDASVENIEWQRYGPLTEITIRLTEEAHAINISCYTVENALWRLDDGIAVTSYYPNSLRISWNNTQYQGVVFDEGSVQIDLSPDLVYSDLTVDVPVSFDYQSLGVAATANSAAVTYSTMLIKDPTDSVQLSIQPSVQYYLSSDAPI